MAAHGLGRGAGRAVAAIERGFQQEIERLAHDQLRAVEQGDRVVVGVNRYAGGEEEPVTIMQLDPAIADAQAKSLVDIRATRDQDAVQAASRTSAPPPGAATTSSRQCATPSATSPPSARSATPSGPSSASTAPPTPSDRASDGPALPPARRARPRSSSVVCGGCSAFSASYVSLF